MSDDDIVQNSISQLGQSQSDRAAAELRSGFVDVDERTPEDLLRFAQGLAGLIEFYRHDPALDRAVRAGDWTAFFAPGGASPAELLSATGGTTPAQLALFLAFLRLYDEARATINTFTDRHLEFYYRRVLRFAPRVAVPDRAHVALELKPHTAPVRLSPAHALSAGKDAANVEQLYRPVRETVINGAKVERLHTIHVDRAGRGTIRIAPVTRSSDGVGGPLPERAPHFAPFGHPALPAGQIGFAVASPLLHMRAGRREVKLSIETASPIPASIPDAVLAGALGASITGEEGWLGAYPVAVTRAGGRVHVSFTVPESAGAVVPYDASRHGHAFATAAPVAQISIAPGSAAVGYRDLAAVVVTRLQLSVAVTGAAAAFVENDAGKLDPKKAFAPFGTQPVVGARFLVGIPEALAKPLTSLSLAIDWLGLPASFATHYASYGQTVSRAGFTASAEYVDGSGRKRTLPSVRLYADSGSTARLDVSPATPPPGGRVPTIAEQVYALSTAGSARAAAAAEQLVMANPMLASRGPAPAPERRFLTLALGSDLLHETYRRKTIQNALAQAKHPDGTPIVLNPPYTPTIRSLAIDYAARTADVDIAATGVADFAELDVQLFHVDPFGQRREHGWLRAELEDVAQRRVPLLPQHPEEGELLIGVAGVAPGESASLLFQVAEGSADPDVEPPDVAWSILCDNHWKRLAGDELALDTTTRFLRSGLVGIVIPRAATTVNTLLPPGYVWLKAAIARDTAAASRMLDVIANAAEVAFLDRGNDPAHLDTPLGAGGIAKLKTPIPAIKAVHQPYASFGGRPTEAAPALVTRASERLRHKNRCITPWDFERIVLEAFPHVHKVKCVPHARGDGTWVAPGHVLLVVVPDLRNDNARDPLQPRVASDVLDAIAVHVQGRTGMQVKVAVSNPTYQQVRLDFKVRFHRGREPGFHVQLLKHELIAFLSPWAFDADRPIAFGGVVYRSVLLDFVEERDYVDYVTDFKMYSSAGTSSLGPGPRRGPGEDARRHPGLGCRARRGGDRPMSTSNLSERMRRAC